jgi:hypothetical protein
MIYQAFLSTLILAFFIKKKFQKEKIKIIQETINTNQDIDRFLSKIQKMSNEEDVDIELVSIGKILIAIISSKE